MLWKNAMMDCTTQIPRMPAAHGADSHTVVMVSPMPNKVRLVMMETTWMVMDVLPTANSNAEMVVLILVRCVMKEKRTVILPLPAAERTANCPSVVMVLLTLGSNVMMELEILLDPTSVDQTVPFLNAVMVLLITCTKKSVTKEDVTPSQQLTAAVLNVLLILADSLFT